MSVFFCCFFSPFFLLPIFGYYFLELHFLGGLEGSIQEFQGAIPLAAMRMWNPSFIVSLQNGKFIIITHMYVPSPLGFAATGVPQSWQLVLRTFCFAVGLCLWTTPLSKECRFSKPAEWYFCWDWGDNLEHTFECKLAWKHKNTRPEKQPIPPKKNHQHTKPVLLLVVFCWGVESPAVNSLRPPEGPESMPRLSEYPRQSMKKDR